MLRVFRKAILIGYWQGTMGFRWAWLPGIFLTTTLAFAETHSCPVTEFRASSQALDKGRIESVLTLACVFRTKAKGQSQECAEQLFVIFRTFYYEPLSQFQEAEGITRLPYPLEDTRKKLLQARLSRVGWALRVTEGSYYVGEAGAWWRSRFGPLLPRSWDGYFHQREVEIREGFSEDAGLLISWERLRQRITFWEGFIRRHPHFPANEEVSSYLDIYIRTFLTGVDNSRIERDFDDPTLRTEVKIAYEAFLRNNKGSKYYDIVKGYYEVLKRNNFRVTREAKAFLESKRVKTMLAVQPPTY